jgi:hypothetical protein
MGAGRLKRSRRLLPNREARDIEAILDAASEEITSWTVPTLSSIGGPAADT